MANIYLGRSEYILRRLLLLQNLEAPTISDVKKNFGDDLAEKIFCNCDISFRKDFGLEPQLEGPIGKGKDLWSSPSDLLIGKVCLKPPLTYKHVQALTHQGILDIGMKVEKLFWNQVEIEKTREFEEHDRMLRLLCETSKREAISVVQKRMMEIFMKQRMELIDEMETLCKKEIRRLEIHHRQNLLDELAQQARELELQYQLQEDEQEEKIRTSETNTIKSAFNIEELELTMKKIMEAQFQKEQIRARFDMQRDEMKCKERLKILRHELECKNLANLMYVICTERKKCLVEKSNLESRITSQLSEVEATLRDVNENLKKVEAERDKHKQEVQLREKALLEVIREFQNFINFSLKAVPNQADYLLCAEKLMIFELTDALCELEASKVEEDDVDRNYLWQRSPSTTDTSMKSLKAHDGHECLKEPEIQASEMSVDQFLPGFYYNDQMFIREDFRDMVSQGIEINENNMLWTEHVQDVIDRMACRSCLFNEEKKLDPKLVEKKKSLISYQSSVHFSMKPTDASQMSMDRDRRFKRASLKPVGAENILQTIDFSHIGSEENRKTLISAKNSLEILKESIIKRRSSIRSEDMVKFKYSLSEKEEYYMENLFEEKELTGSNAITNSRLLIETRDSLINAKVHQVMASTTDLKHFREDIDTRRPSRLITVNDSLEVVNRRQSHVSQKMPSKKEATCDVPDCTLREGTSQEQLKVEKSLEDLSDDILPNELPRRISIAFTGKSTFYEEEKQLASKRKVMDKKNVIKVKKTPSFNMKIERIRPKKHKRVPTHKTHGKLESVTVSTQTSEEALEIPKSSKDQKRVVVKEPESKEYQEDHNQFARLKVNSFVNIMKEYPDLIRLFTSVSR